MSDISDPDDLAAFRAAVAGAKPLTADNRVVLPPPRSRRMPSRAREEARATEEKPRSDQASPWPAHWHREGTIPKSLPADPESKAFVLAMSGVQPLPDTNRANLNAPLPRPRPRQSIADEKAALHESLHGRIDLQDRLEGGDEPNYLRIGVAASVLRDLRRGRWVVQSEIDLHGMNRDEARHALATFMAESLHQGIRCVRVVHGKGLGSPQKLSILRQLVRGWLAQRIEVLAFCQAKPHDGGEGALIVLLHARKV
jgi:DNA-nicking Smr family endonuclease